MIADRIDQFERSWIPGQRPDTDRVQPEGFRAVIGQDQHGAGQPRPTRDGGGWATHEIRHAKREPRERRQCEQPEDVRCDPPRGGKCLGGVQCLAARNITTREVLLTAMIIESYGHLDSALAEAPRAGTPARRWINLARALRDWALTNPHEFQLVYGTPIPDYVAPPETIPAAAAVARHFLAVGAVASVADFDRPSLIEQLSPAAVEFSAETNEHTIEPIGMAAVLAELATLVGSISLELDGHLVGTADPGDHLYAAILDRQVNTLGLSRDTIEGDQPSPS